MKVFFTGKNSRQGLTDVDPTSLVSVAKKHGYTISEDLTREDECVVCVDFAFGTLKVVRKAKRLGVRTCLVVNEPSVVIPQHAQQRILNKFDKAIFVGRTTECPKLKWPQTWTHLREGTSRLDKAVVVNADKWSFVRGHQYWLRAALSSKSSIVDVFGPGWERSVFEKTAHRLFEFLRILFSGCPPDFTGLQYLFAKPVNYLGTVNNKIDAMSRYKVAIVIENSSELLTEKLFDTWFAGCVPVFVGPKLKEYGLPQDLVVESLPDVESLQKAIEHALNFDIHEFQGKVKTFLLSSEAEEWRAEQAISQVLQAAIAASNAN